MCSFDILGDQCDALCKLLVVLAQTGVPSSKTISLPCDYLDQDEISEAKEETVHVPH